MTERSLFIQALEITDPRERSALLDNSCKADPALRGRVEKLLAAHAAAGGILDQPPPAAAILPSPHGRGVGGEGAPTTDRQITEGPGTIIGPYKLIQLLGEGGMGVVYMAQQTEPVKRLVALKIIKPGMDSRQVIARFEAERQALALMDHPNIAKVLDAGVTGEGVNRGKTGSLLTPDSCPLTPGLGRPYFVMELVKGIPITTYCDEKRLTPRERLELFIPVCHAVQHAHQKGIVHRDLKPSNVMIALYDGRPVPKVIDFGVAKAAGGQLTEKTLVTSFGSLVGTLEYMSPEQAELNQLDVDTRSDIYSLGVLLYELLTGDTPFDRKRLRSAAFDEMLRIIREEEPPLPSTRLSAVRSAELGVLKTNNSGLFGRLFNPKSKIQNLKSFAEIDWIIMKALEKDRSRRYETANGLARDIQRYLADESVEACPPSLGYRLSKISRRYRTPLTIAAAFVGLLLTGVAVSTWQRNVALAAAASEKRARQAATTERERAEANAKAAQANEQAALQEKNRTIAAQEELRHAIYAIDMGHVQAAAENRQFSRAAQLLELHRPAPGQPDSRGFEWHYWQRQLQRGRRSVEVPLFAEAGGFWNRIFSQGAARLATIVQYPKDSPLYTNAGLMVVFDGVTGREVVAPIDPCPDVPAGNRSLRLAMSDDGTRLAAAVSLGTESYARGPAQISIRDGGTGKEIRRIEGLANVSDLALTRDGSRLAVTYGEQVESRAALSRSLMSAVKIWDTSTGELLQTLPLLPTDRLADRILWSPDGTRLLRESVSSETVNESTSYRERFQVVEVATGTAVWDYEFPSHRSSPRRAWAWSPDGKLVVIIEAAEPGVVAKRNVQLWDSTTRQVLAILDRESPLSAVPTNIGFSPDGKRLAVVSQPNDIYVWDLPELPAAGASPLHIAAPDLTLRTGERITALAFSKDGRELHCATFTSIVIWDAAVRDDSGLGPDFASTFFTAAISADATQVAFAWGDTQEPMNSVWDLAKNQEVFRINGAGSYRSPPAFSPDGRRVALVRRGGTLQEPTQIVIHDIQTGAELKTIPVEKPDPSIRAFIEAPVFRPDGGQIAAFLRPIAQNQGPAFLMVWDVATGRQLYSVPTRADYRTLVYSQDGAGLIVGTTGQTGGAVVFYDAVTGKEQRSIPVPVSKNSYQLDWFIDVRHQLVGGADGSDFVFCDLASGKERLRVPQTSFVRTYAITPDGSRLVLAPSISSTGETELTFWSLKSGRRLLAFNCQARVDALSFSPDANRLVVAFARSSTGGGGKAIQIYDATPLP